MEQVIQVFRDHAELGIFLTLALGFLIGRIRVGHFTVGPMLGSLFAGMLVGQMVIEVPDIVKVIFFDLFLFATGYKVGPQFFRGLRKDALPQLLLTLIICTTCLLTAILVSKIMGYDAGTAAGLLAGAFSESTVIGTAGDAIRKLSITEAEKTDLINAIPVAYTVTYLVGTTSIVWFLSTMAPKLLRINLREESRKLADTFSKSGGKNLSPDSAYREWAIRAIQVHEGEWVGKRIHEIEKNESQRILLVENMRKQGTVMEPAGHILIEAGDVLAIACRRNTMVEHVLSRGTEVEDRELLDFPLVNRDIVITHKNVTGRPLGELAREHGEGVMLNRLTRSGQEIPFDAGTILEQGDILNISGRPAEIDEVTKVLGFREIHAHQTDILFLAVGILTGSLVGLLSMNLAGVELTLSTSGGALVMGLVFGWLHARTPAWGRIPEAALWVFDTLGLAVFLSAVGLSAGPSVIEGVQKIGFGIIPAGLVVSLLPHIVGMLAGKFLLKMNPVILLGAQSGAGTTTVGLKAIQDAAMSKLPVLGYTVPYALGNILLTAWGPVLVSLMT
jgi:putative transport protein